MPELQKSWSGLLVLLILHLLVHVILHFRLRMASSSSEDRPVPMDHVPRHVRNVQTHVVEIRTESSSRNVEVESVR